MKTTTRPHKTSRCRPRRHAAFTLIELMAVVGIIVLIASVVLALNPGNPGGLLAAQSTAASLFKTARLKAQTPLPTRDGKKLDYGRARVLILKDPTKPEQHLRLMRVIVGGVEVDPAKPNNNPQSKDYFWYSTEIESVLPKGNFMIDEDATIVGGEVAFDIKQRSNVSHRDAIPTTMLMNYEHSLKGSKDGEGDKEWYFYEFGDDGTSNMISATFMIGEANWNPVKKQPVFLNNKDISGLWISPTGETIPFSDSDEMLKQDKD